jgi:1-deoxy-D-xylulose-5-phosphate reductoisomerase
MKRLAIVGSTGSIGQNTLRVVDHLSDHFTVFALAANSAVDRLAEQAAAFRPEVVAIMDDRRAAEFRKQCGDREMKVPEIVTGESGLDQVASATEVDIVVSAAVGAAGLRPTYSAGRQPAKLWRSRTKRQWWWRVNCYATPRCVRALKSFPIDSEHSAVDQCLRSGQRPEVRRLILTASGGPFRETPVERFGSITPEEALKHPTWRMGKRITIDSATVDE